MSRSMAGLPAEVSLAINPARPGNVIAVSLASGLEVRSTNFSFVSHDGGLTWSWLVKKRPSSWNMAM